MQSNIGGEIITLNQEYGCKSNYIILYAAAYTRNGIAMADGVAAFPANVIGVHISSIYKREEERNVDLIAKYCEACLFGFGLDGYRLAMEYITRQENEK